MTRQDELRKLKLQKAAKKKKAELKALRDDFAFAALTGLISNAATLNEAAVDDIAASTWKIAEAVIEAR